MDQQVQRRIRPVAQDVAALAESLAQGRKVFLQGLAAFAAQAEPFRHQGSRLVEEPPRVDEIRPGQRLAKIAFQPGQVVLEHLRVVFAGRERLDRRSKMVGQRQRYRRVRAGVRRGKVERVLVAYRRRVPVRMQERRQCGTVGHRRFRGGRGLAEMKASQQAEQVRLVVLPAVRYRGHGRSRVRWRNDRMLRSDRPSAPERTFPYLYSTCRRNTARRDCGRGCRAAAPSRPRQS